MNVRPRSIAVAIVALAAATFTTACDKLTSPPEPIAVDTTTSAAAPAAKTAQPTHPSAQPAPGGQPTPGPTASAVPAVAAALTDKVKTQDVVVGKGAEVKNGDTLAVHYVGTLTNGKEFDSSRKRGQPMTFVLGDKGRIAGWDMGMAGMKVGGKRKITIPPSLGYGERGAGSAIPPNSTLQFEIELLEIKKK